MSQANGMTELDDAPSSAAEADYQSLTPWSAFALLLALLSLTALASPLLLAIPAAAIGAALLALSRIRAAGGTLTGARMARFSIALATVCIVAPLVRDKVRDTLMERQTTEVAQAWLTQVAAGQISESKALISLQALGALGPRSEEPGGPPPDPKVVDAVVLEKLRAEPLMKRLAEFEAPLKVTLASASFVPVFDGLRINASAIYRVESADDHKPLLVQLNFLRQDYYEKEGRPWRVDHWAIVDSVKSATAK